MSSKPPKPKPEPKTDIGKKTKEVLEKIWEPIDIVGQNLIGSLWRTLYLAIQDTIALSLILQLPGFVGHTILGKDFSSFDVCLNEGALGVSRYACFVIVISDLCMWIALAGRIMGRFYIELCDLRQGGNNGSN